MKKVLSFFLTALMTLNLFVVPVFADTAADEEAVANTLKVVTLDQFTTQSKYAVTKSLNLAPAALASVLEANGTELEFESGSDAITIDGTKGRIKQGNTAVEASLIVTAKKNASTDTKTITFTVPKKGTYIYDSNGFGYPEYKDNYITKLDNWSGPEGDTTYTGYIKENNGEYYADIKRVQGHTSPKYYKFDFSNARPTKKLKVEMDLTYQEDAQTANLILDLELYGKNSQGGAVSSRMMYTRIHPTIVSVEGEGTRLSLNRVAKGNTNHLEYVFDFENQCYDLYIDGSKKTSTPKPFPTNSDIATLNYLNISYFRTSYIGEVYLDNFAVTAEDPEFTTDYIDALIKRPMSVTLGSWSTAGEVRPQFTVKTSYNDTYDLAQNFVLLHQNKNDKVAYPFKNVHFDFSGSYLSKKSDATKTHLDGGMANNSYPYSDETAPFTINKGYIGANHAGTVPVVTATAHGKTYADIGSIWKDTSNNKWTLIRIIDENKLMFIYEVPYTEETKFTWSKTQNWKSSISGTKLTCADTSYAVNTSDITIGSQTADQAFPSIRNVDPHIYAVVDGVREELDIYGTGTHECDEFVMDIKYEIMNPVLIGAALREARPEGGYTEAQNLNVGEPMLKYHLTMTVTEDGTVFTEFDHEVLENLGNLEYYGQQWYARANAFGGGVYRYVPGTKAFSTTGIRTNTTKTFDFTEPWNMYDKENTEFPSSYTQKAKDWSDPNFVPDRVVDYLRDTDGNNVMAYATGYLPILDAEPTLRRQNTTSSLYIYGKKNVPEQKTYPIFVGAADKFVTKGDKIRGVAYRKYANLDDNKNDVEVYEIEHGNDVYYYVDFFNASEAKINLADDYAVYDASVVYSTTDDYTLVNNVLDITGAKKDFVILKAKRGIEITVADYDKFGMAVSLRVKNRLATQPLVAPKMFAVAYKDNVLLRMSEIKDLAEGAIVDEELEIDASDADTVKVFIWDNLSGTKSYAYSKTISIPQE